jgi:hypothetical protein
MPNTKLTEKQIETSILDYLSLLPASCKCWAWKNNNGAVYDGRRGVFRKPMSKYLINGVSDIVGMYKGKPLFLEVKTSKAPSRVTAKQKHFIERTKNLGAISAIVTSIEDVQNVLREYDT